MSRQEIQVVVESEWWQVVLSGVIGSVIGGLLTLAGVLLVIRHERRVRREDVLSSSMTQLMTVIGRIMIEDYEGSDRKYSKREFRAVKDKYIYALDMAFTQSSTFEPELNGLLSAAIGDAEDQFTEDNVVALYYIAKVWLDDPDSIRSGRVTIEAIREMAQDLLKLHKRTD